MNRSPTSTGAAVNASSSTAEDATGESRDGLKDYLAGFDWYQQRHSMLQEVFYA